MSGDSERCSGVGVYPRARLGLELALLLSGVVAALWVWLRPLYWPALSQSVRRLPLVLAALVPTLLGGLVALQLHCPITHRAHLLAGHASVPWVLALAYGLLRIARVARKTARRGEPQAQ